MATVNSLVCWGGLTGKVVTFTVSGSVMNSTDIGVKDGLPVWLSGGTLPTGLSAGTIYYARKGADANKATLHSSKAHAIAGTGQVTFSTTGSGTIYAKSSLMFTGTDLSRWGNTRIFDSIKSWNYGRAGADSHDEEFCEIGEAFRSREFGATINVPSLSSTVTATVNGIATDAHHLGSPGKGFEAVIDQPYYGGISTTRYFQNFDGFSLVNEMPSGWGNTLLTVGGKLNNITDMLVEYRGGAPLVDDSIGVSVAAIGVRVMRCLVFGGHKIAITCGYNMPYCYYCDNTVVGNGTGFNSQYSGATGFYYNNVALGNTTNWSAPGSAIEGASNNAGGTGEAWVTGSGSRVEITESSPFAATFVDYTNKDFRPKSGSSLIDAGYTHPVIGGYDIARTVRPNYNNGGAEAVDIGAFEFDHGYGLPPATCTLTLTNVVVGSRINIRDQAGTTTHYDALAASSTVVVPITVYGSSLDNWRIRVRKASGSPNYIPYETLMTAIAGATSIYVSQIPDE